VLGDEDALLVWIGGIGQRAVLSAPEGFGPTGDLHMQLALFTPSLGSVALWTALLVWRLPELVGVWRQRSRTGAIMRDRRSEASCSGASGLASCWRSKPWA
jgi:hypothetical protein